MTRLDDSSPNEFSLNELSLNERTFSLVLDKRPLNAQNSLLFAMVKSMH